MRPSISPRVLLALLTLPALLALPGCSDDASSVLDASGDELAAAMEEVALEADALTADVLTIETDNAASSAAARGEESGGTSVTRSFNATRSCPAGGEVAVQGSLTRTADNSSGANVVEVTAAGSQSASGCTFVREALTVTINGASQWDHFRRRVDGAPDGPQTSSYSGAWNAVASNGEERSCEFDFTVVRDPGARTRTVDGMMCGLRIRRHVDWDLRD